VQKDYQQSINTSENSANSSEEYNSLETSVCRENGAQIISTVTVRKDNGTDIEVKLDQHGYSHVQLIENVKDEVSSPVTSLLNCHLYILFDDCKYFRN
jgi:hypothetical protein